MSNSNTINVNKLLHEYCKLKISPLAVKEIKGRIVDKLFDIAPELDRIAKKHNRLTIQENDVIEALGQVHVEVM